MIYFTADQHFGHANIIEYCDRPFKNKDIMANIIVKNHNSVVGQDDIVYIIGDLSLVNTDGRNYLEKIIKSLNGTLHLIMGNHDRLRPFTYIDMGITSVHTSLEVGEFILNHDPAASCMDRERTWLCGHIHNLFKYCKNVVNVGVDVWDFKPVAIDCIREIKK